MNNIENFSGTMKPFAAIAVRRQFIMQRDLVSSTALNYAQQLNVFRNANLYLIEPRPKRMIGIADFHERSAGGEVDHSAGSAGRQISGLISCSGIFSASWIARARWIGMRPLRFHPETVE